MLNHSPGWLARLAFPCRKTCVYSKDCVGGLDGTHVAALSSCKGSPSIPKSYFAKHSCRVWLPTWSLNICLLDGEGSAHDTRVLEDAITNGGMQVPPGKYLLVDAGDYNADFALTSYCGVRYQLKKQVLGPGNKEKAFNALWFQFTKFYRVNTWDT